MTVAIKQIKESIFDWVRDYSVDECLVELKEEKIIWADQSGFQPEAPYITLKIISGTTEIGDKDALDYDPIKDTYTSMGTRTMTLSVNCFGEGANEILSKLESSLHLPEVREYFHSKEMTPYDNTGVLDVSGILETVYEERANLDVLYYVVSKIVSKVKAIDTSETPVIN